MAKQQGLIGPSYTLRTANYDAQRTINMFPEMNELQTGKEQEVAQLVSVPGQILVDMLPKSPIRALYFTSFGYIVCVAGNTVYYLNSPDKGLTWTNPTVIADLTTSTGPVCISDGIPNYLNGVANTGMVNQVVVVDGSNYGVVFEEGTTNAIQLNNGNSYNGASFVTFQDGFFIFTQNSQSPTVFFAADPLNISDLDEVTVNLGPDYVSRVISDHDILWFFGGRSSSVWQNTGGSLSSNIFQQIPGSYAEGGCAFPQTIAKCSGQLMWLQSDERGFGQVFQGAGYRGVRVSNHAVETWIQSFADLSGATAWTYQDGGHSFYALNIPTATTTWVYDLNTKMWSERAFYKNGVFNRDLIEHHITLYGPNYNNIHLCSGYNSNRLYTLSNSSYILETEPIYRMRTSPHASNGLDRIFFSQAQIDLETGVGLDGDGYAYPTGYNPVGYTDNAINIPLNGNGTSGIYTIVGNDGNPAIPASLPSISASGTWSNSVSWTPGTSVITVNPTTFTIPSTVFGMGTGNLSNYTFTSGGLASGTVVNSATITATDWRGSYDQSTTPISNMCTDSEDFADTGTWSYDGCTIAPSSWNQYPTVTTGVYRPSTNTPSTSSGSITNPTYAYNATYDTLKVSGTSALFQASGGTSGTTFAQDIYSNFGVGLNIKGTLNICLSSLSPNSSITGLFFAQVYHSIDGGTNWILDEQASGGLASPGNQPDFNTALPVVINLSVPDISLLQVKVVAGTDRTAPGTEIVNVYDVVFIKQAVNVDSTILQNAPDGNNTGTYLIEDTSNGYHAIECSYTPKHISDHVCASVYYQIGDSSRNLELAVIGQQAVFTGSITGNQLTILTPPTSGAISVGMSIEGTGIPSGTTIASGTSSPYTLSITFPTPILPTTLTCYNFLAHGLFSPAGVATVLPNATLGTANMVAVGTVFSGSITGNQLTVNELYTGTLNVGNTILGTGIPGGTTITSGTSSPYTISWAATTPVLSEIMSATGGSSTGIYRCYVEGTELDLGTHHAGIYLHDTNSQYGNQYIGNGASKIGIWGFQIQNTSLSQYIKSTNGVVGTDYVTPNLTTGTVEFNIPPYNGATLSWHGQVHGQSVNPTLYLATFTYTRYPLTTVYIGVDPQIRLSYSDDGGHTFSPEMSTAIGKVGTYLSRCIWRRLGMSRDRTWRITCSDPIKFSLIGAEFRVKKGELG